MKILVIEDDTENQQLIKAMVRQFHPDSEVILCDSGREGLALAVLKSPDVILLDLVMPGMDGMAVCDALKSNEVTEVIPVIMISAIGQSPEVRVEGFRHGAEAFLSKPVDLFEFKGILAAALRYKSNEEVSKKRNQDRAFLMTKQSQELGGIENRFLQISDHNLQFFWEIDERGRIIYVSSAAELILGFSIEEIIGKKFLYFFCQDDDKRKIRDYFSKYILKKLSFHEEELKSTRINGSVVWMSVSGFPVFHEEGGFNGYRGILHDITLRKRVEDELHKSLREIQSYQKKLKSLNTALTLAEERERRRIAEYLHDQIGPTISLANMKLSSIQSKRLRPEIRNRITESVTLIQEAIGQSRSLTYDLSPPVLYELGLEAALKWKLRQIEEKFDILTELVLYDSPIKIREEMSVMLFRIVSELFMNIVKHANANLIRVAISKTSSLISLTIQDNGTSKNKKVNGSSLEYEGVGMFLIRERLDSIQGTMLEENHPGSNTVKVIAPIK